MNDAKSTKGVKAMDLTKLKEQRAALDAQIAAAEQEAKQTTWRQIETLLANAGLTKADLISHYSGKAPSRKKDPVAPKYRSQDGKHEWSGRGAMVGWMKEAIAKNPKLTKESFLIK